MWRKYFPSAILLGACVGSVTAAELYRIRMRRHYGDGSWVIPAAQAAELERYAFDLCYGVTARFRILRPREIAHSGSSTSALPSLAASVTPYPATRPHQAALDTTASGGTSQYEEETVVAPSGNPKP